jgi:DeoR/GlpR family transcriptional regulator of sugar metabolism
LANRFHQVSTKTLRNDIRQLIAEGRLERVVKANGALAELKLSS